MAFVALVSAVPTPHRPRELQPVALRQSIFKQGARLGCKSISEMAKNSWCKEMCAKIPPNCPEDMCECPPAEVSKLSYAGTNLHVIGAWCR